MLKFPVVVAALLWPAFVLAQQLPQAPPPDCQAQLAQALTLQESIQQVASQRREGIVRYFQEENRKANDEILTLRKELETLKNGASSAGKDAK